MFGTGSFVFAQPDTTVRNSQVILQVIQVKDSSITNQNANSPDLLKQTDNILYHINGITLIKRGNYAQEPTIRGLNAGQINLTLDGMQIFGACTDRMDPVSSYVEPNNLGRIQLNLSPSEGQYGNHHGSIDFKLLKAQPNAKRQLDTRIGFGLESNALAAQVLGNIHYSRKRWAVQFNGIYRKAHDYVAGGNETVKFSQYEKWNYGGSFTYLTNESNSINIHYLMDEGYNIGYPALTMDVAFAKAKIGSISHLYHRTGKRLYHWETKFYANYIDHAMDDTRRPPETVPMHMDMPGNSFTAGFYSGGSLRISEKQLLDLRLTGYQNNLHAEMTMYPDIGNEMFMLTIPDAQRRVLGLNATDKIFFNNKTNISVGGRIEKVNSEITTEIGRQTVTSFYLQNPDKSFWTYSASIQLNHKVRKNTSFSCGIQRVLRNPTLHEMYGFYLYNRLDGYDYIGNPDITPESSFNINLSGIFKAPKLFIKGQAFSYFFTNYISAIKLDDFSEMTIGAFGVKQYNNLPNASIFGGEITFGFKLFESLNFESLNSYSIGLDHEKDALPFIPPFKSFNKITYDLKGYKFHVEYVTATAQNHVDTDKYGETLTPSFHLFNISVSKRFIVNKLVMNFSLQMKNIFDSLYYEHLDIMKIPRQGRNMVFYTVIEL